MLRLELPTVRARASFLAAMGEFRADGRGSADDHTNVGDDLREWGGTWDSEAEFQRYVDALLAEQTQPRRTGWVTATTWWWLEGEEYLGRLAFRHTLTPFLLEVGGHIGYDVRPSARRQGHATAMLAEAPLVHAMGVDPALLTCDYTNTASRKVIESNGGLLEDRRGDKLRFWVPTRPRTR